MNDAQNHTPNQTGTEARDQARAHDVGAVAREAGGPAHRVLAHLAGADDVAPQLLEPGDPVRGGVGGDEGAVDRADARADDDRLLPLYEACADLGVPAFVMSGPTTPDLAFNDPLAVDRVARTFPKLPIVCCHGFYPNIDAIITVAFRNENVFVSPDMYTFAPGGRRYVEAANGFMRDQFLFGSSYPFRPMRQGVEDFRALGLEEEPLRKALWGNAAGLFGLTP